MSLANKNHRAECLFVGTLFFYAGGIESLMRAILLTGGAVNGAMGKK